MPPATSFPLLLNATAHDQSDQVNAYTALGWTIEVVPRLRRCEPTEEAMEEEAHRVADGIPDNDAVLIGGLGYLCDALALRLLPKGCHLYTALTNRISDASGRYLFTGPVAVVETPLSRHWHSSDAKVPYRSNA